MPGMQTPAGFAVNAIGEVHSVYVTNVASITYSKRVVVHVVSSLPDLF